MKHLLAYLFIILGLGLTFSVNANAEQSQKKTAICVGGDWLQMPVKSGKENSIAYVYFYGTKPSILLNGNKISISLNCRSMFFPGEKSYDKYYSLLNSEFVNKDYPIYTFKNKGNLTTGQLKQLAEAQAYSLNKLKEQSQTQPGNNSEEVKKKITEEKKKIEEEKRKITEAKKKKEEEKKRIAEAKKKEQEEQEQKRIAEAKKKEQEEQKYRILVRKYGDDCKDNSLGSPEFNKCLKDVEAEDLLQTKLQREFLASLTPEEVRAYTCNNTFGFKKGSSNFKDCIFKLYTTELELEKLDLEKQLALAKVEAEKAKADTARAQVEIIQARSAAARAEGKLQEAQIQATKAQTLSMQQQAAASRQQAAAAQAQARAAQQQNSINLMTQGLKMLSGNQSSSSRLRTNCSWSSIGISCR